MRNEPWRVAAQPESNCRRGNFRVQLSLICANGGPIPHVPSPFFRGECSFDDFPPSLYGRQIRCSHIASLLLFQIVSAVAALHDAHIIHYDIKCDNILLRSALRLGGSARQKRCCDICVIADFGCADVRPTTPVADAFSCKARGTECIQSPEMLTISRDTNGAHCEYDRRRKAGTNAASDVWGLGCLLFELFAGEPLFHRLEWTEFFVRLTHSVTGVPELISDSDLERASPGATPLRTIVGDLLRMVLVRDRKMRPLLADVKAAVARAIDAMNALPHTGTGSRTG